MGRKRRRESSGEETVATISRRSIRVSLTAEEKKSPADRGAGRRVSSTAEEKKPPADQGAGRRASLAAKEKEPPADRGVGRRLTAECPTCDRVIKHRLNLANHIRSQHGGRTPAIHCPICNIKTFQSEASLRSHRSRKHMTIKPQAPQPTPT